MLKTNIKYLKKAAVFGIEIRALKKQFGKLFLVRLQSVDSQETHGASINKYQHLKKAAVFGIDARIAIAIFSILSIVGTIYSAELINKAQEDNVVEQVKTLRQAAMQNLADNDYDYTIDDAVLNKNLFGVSDKVGTSHDLTRGRNNYDYIKQTNPSATVGKTLINTPERVIEVVNNNMFSSDAATGALSKTTDCVDTADECYYWFKLTNVNNISFKYLDEYYDGTTGGLSDATSITTGIIVAPTVDLPTDTATVLVKIGERL